MASGLSGAVVLALCAVLVPCVFASGECTAYRDLMDRYHRQQYCSIGFCCGTCFNRYCCTNSVFRFTEDEQEDCITSDSYSSPFPMVVGIVSGVIILLIFICCCVCPCCCLYKLCRKPQPVIATTHTTIVTPPQQYPQQSTATPGYPQSYQGSQYPPYQPIPVQPGYAAQPVPQAYGTQSMPAAPYPAQPFTAGPPPTYQEAIGPAYPPNPMPYSQAAFSPNQPAYPPQPPVQAGPNAPPAQTDFLAQPAFNPDYVPPKTG